MDSNIQNTSSVSINILKIIAHFKSKSIIVQSTFMGNISLLLNFIHVLIYFNSIRGKNTESIPIIRPICEWFKNSKAILLNYLPVLSCFSKRKRKNGNILKSICDSVASDFSAGTPRFCWQTFRSGRKTLHHDQYIKSNDDNRMDP